MQKEIAREKRGIVIWGNEGNPNSLGQTEMKEREEPFSPRDFAVQPFVSFTQLCVFIYYYYLLLSFLISTYYK